MLKGGGFGNPAAALVACAVTNHRVIDQKSHFAMKQEMKLPRKFAIRDQKFAKQKYSGDVEAVSCKKSTQ